MENSFKLKLIDCNEKELKKIGFDKTYLRQGALKHNFRTIKICDINCAQANIIKQTALTTGTDCAVHREVITGKVDISDCILSGSVSQLVKIAEKLKYQPFKLNILSEQIKKLVSLLPDSLYVRDISIEWGKKTYIMGILNITPDSFSDGGEYFGTDKAIEHYKSLVQDGADFIDIGGESTRPFSKKISAQEEQSRVVPIIKEIREFDSNTVISIDTRNASTARAAINAGADIINDVSALDWDEEMINILKDTKAPVVLNHSKGSPDVMQNDTCYTDVVDEIFDYLYKKIDFLVTNGIEQNKIIVDPGIGFGKSTEQNFEIIKRIEEFKSLGCPVLVGHSRKNFISETIESKDNSVLDTATLILSQMLADKKVDIIRVHNVKQHNILQKLNQSLAQIV